MGFLDRISLKYPTSNFEWQPRRYTRADGRTWQKCTYANARTSRHRSPS